MFEKITSPLYKAAEILLRLCYHSTTTRETVWWYERGTATLHERTGKYDLETKIPSKIASKLDAILWNSSCNEIQVVYPRKEKFSAFVEINGKRNYYNFY